MASTTGTGDGETVGLPVVGQEGDTCEQCGSVLATDQRYCLNCGWRRGESRVDYEKRLNGGRSSRERRGGRRRPRRDPAVDSGLRDPRDRAARRDAAARSADRQEGQRQHPDRRRPGRADHDRRRGAAHRHHGDHRQQQQGRQGRRRRRRARPGQRRPGRQRLDATGIAAANTSASVQQNAKSGPDVVATQGKPEALDPNGQAGGGSGATCIGC